jgi:hypothetical protein
MLWEHLDSPGPAYKPRWDVGKSLSPRWTVKLKFKDKAPERTGEHIPPRSTLGGHKWTFPHSFRPEIVH